MNLNEFIKNGVTQYEYFDIENTNPKQLEKLSGLELQYFEDRNVIYKEKYMDDDYQLKTYIFAGSQLSFMINYDKPSHSKTLHFYRDNELLKKVTYTGDVKSSLSEYKNKKEVLRITFPQSSSDKITGYKYVNNYIDRFEIVKTLQLENNIQLQKVELSLTELEKYI